MANRSKPGGNKDGCSKKEVISELIDELKNKKDISYKEKVESLDHLIKSQTHSMANLLSIVNFSLFKLSREYKIDEDNVFWKNLEYNLDLVGRYVHLIRSISDGEEANYCFLPVGKFFDDLAMICQGVCGSKIEVICDCPSLFEYSLFANENYLFQAFLNLAYNSREAIFSRDVENKKFFKISYKVFKENCLEIMVSDSGAGVKNESGLDIFDVLFSTKGEIGLGLRISRRIINETGGFMNYVNGSGGAIFRIVLPIFLN